METKANYVAVGAFTVLVFVAAFAFVWWIARTDTGGQTARLDILIEGSVTGLTNSSVVKYNGIDVGKINRLDLDRSDPEIVRAEAQVRRDLPLTAKTTAVVSFTGLTGIAHVELEGGSYNSATNLFTVADRNGTIAQIRAKPTPLNDLLATAQDIADRADRVLSEFEGFATDARAPLTKAVDNVSELTDVLAANSGRLDQFLTGMGDLGGSIEKVAASLEQTLSETDRLLQAITPQDVEALVADAREFANNITTASEGFEQLVETAQTTLGELEATGARIDQSMVQVEAIVAAVDPEQVNQAVAGFAQAGAAAGSIATDARGLIETLDQTAKNADALIAAVNPDEITTVVDNVRAFTGDLRQTLDGFDTMLATGTRTLQDFEGVGARIDQSLDQVDGVLEAVNPQTVDEAITAFAQASQNAEKITQDVAGVTAAFEGRQADVQTIFANVTEMTERLNAASVRVDGVLTRIETFIGTGDGDGQTLMAEASQTLASFRQVADNLNGRLDRIGSGLERFSDRGLREVEALINETRQSISRIEQAITSIERDPQRLIFGGDGNVRRFEGRQRR